MLRSTEEPVPSGALLRSAAHDVAGQCMAGVLTFRLLTFWLPILPGFLAFRYLQRRQVL